MVIIVNMVMILTVMMMAMLQVLYLQQNKLKSLPSSLGNLTKLTTLNLSENALKVNIIMMITMYKGNLGNNSFLLRF